MLPISSEELVRDYLRLILRATPVSAATFFMPAVSRHPAPSLLVHDGGSSPTAELADRGAAARFARSMRVSPPPWLRSASEGGWLVRIPSLRPLLAQGRIPPDGIERRSAAPDDPLAECPDSWLGLRIDGDTAIERLLARIPVLRVPPESPGDTAEWWNWAIGAGSALSWHRRVVSTLLDDPVCGLPGRAALQAAIQQSMRTLGGKGRRATLILINPDGFESVNKRLGRQAGDRAIREIAEQLSSCVRRTDLPFRYGGAIFAVSIPALTDESARAVVEKISRTLSEAGYLDGHLRLTFSLGVGSHEPRGGEDASSAMLTLIRRADHALNTAKTEGGARAVFWRDDMEINEDAQHDRLTGIFTADPARDYRNMLLLWETVRAVSSRFEEFDRLAPGVMRRLAGAFGASFAAIFEPAPSGGFEATVSFREGTSQDPALEAIPGHLIAQARAEGCLLQRIVENTDPERRLCVVPLNTADSCLGVLCLEGLSAQFRLDSPDALFLEGLAGQLTLAMNRSRSAAAERERHRRETRRLQSEVRELREALGRAKLIHVSEAMDRLLDAARRAAVTDATVLVSGESGTGKELIARTIHELSPRKDKPLVVVDCSAIATTLIDSELFGHERGAFTGADRASPGRLREAHGGTVLLDEVGELPLEVQSKLLRFVQERQFTPVGSTRSRSVDVRVIAATNRDLAREVREGRFREDLYYRLKVVHLEVPPLRERGDDVRLLASHFARQFGVQYQKPVEGFTPDAEHALGAHDWAGNVRELRNRVLQAVVLSEGKLLDAASLGFAQREPSANVVTAATPPPDPPPESEVDAVDADAWSALRVSLGRRVESITSRHPARPIPLGKWIEDDLVLAAHAAADGVASRGAETLGIPETTFRRRLRKASGKELSGLATRPEDWDEIREIIARAVAEQTTEQDLVERARAVVLRLLEERLDGDVRLGAALMGVTEPTYRRWRTEKGEQPAKVADATTPGNARS